VTRALHTRGLAEARLLLQDWLSSFVTRCVRSRTRADGLVRNAATLEMILEQQHPHLTVRKVSTCPQRSVWSPTPPPPPPLPLAASSCCATCTDCCCIPSWRLIRTLIRGWLTNCSSRTHPRRLDWMPGGKRVPHLTRDGGAGRTGIRGFNAAQLAAAVYPRLTAYDSAHAAAAHDFLPLSRHALVHGGNPFFLLDGTTWLVLYLSAANADLNARPGKDSTCIVHDFEVASFFLTQ
jgi:hypothetical protein